MAACANASVAAIRLSIGRCGCRSLDTTNIYPEADLTLKAKALARLRSRRWRSKKRGGETIQSYEVSADTVAPGISAQTRA